MRSISEPSRNKAISKAQVLVVDSDFSYDKIPIWSPADLMGLTYEFSFEGASSLRDALNYMRQKSVDVILLDPFLPDASGIVALEVIRKQRRDLPVIIYSKQVSADLAFELIQNGAQDFLVKGSADLERITTSLAFAIIRLESLHKEMISSKTGELRTIAHHKMLLNPVRQTLEVQLSSGAREVISLTAFEFRLMALFLQQEGEILSRESILQRMRAKDEADLNERTIDVHISMLRQKSGRLRKLIRSVYGQGYTLTFARGD